MKKICFLILLVSVSTLSIGQEVINSKGTRINIDSSKWSLSGNNIYFKRSGNVGIGINSPAAQLHTTGTVRFQGLGTSTTNTKVLTADNSGNISFQSLPGLNGIDSVLGDTPAAVVQVGKKATVKNDSAYWNADQLQGKSISSTAPTTGQLLQWNGTAWTPVTPEVTSARLTSNFTTSSTNAANSNLRFAIGANESYYVVVEGSASKASTNTGLKLAIGAPSGCTISGEAYLGGNSVGTAQTPSLITAINTLGSTFASSAGTQVTFRMTFVVTNSSTAGFITLQAATVTSNVATIYAGTRMHWEKVSGL